MCYKIIFFSRSLLWHSRRQMFAEISIAEWTEQNNSFFKHLFCDDESSLKVAEEVSLLYRSSLLPVFSSYRLLSLLNRIFLTSSSCRDETMYVSSSTRDSTLYDFSTEKSKNIKI